MKKKIIAHLSMLLLVVYVSLSFAQHYVKIIVSKDDAIEADLAGFNIYQDDNATPIATLDAHITPWQWCGEITTINGVSNFSATSFDTAGQESIRGEVVTFDPPPSPPTLEVYKRDPEGNIIK